MQTTKIYIISLKRIPERRKFMEAQLSALGLEAEFVEAVDGLELSEAAIKANCVNEKITPTEIAAAWSHRNVYQRLIDSEEEYALVLEDDAVLWPNIIPFLELIPKIASDWELIHLCWQSMVRVNPYPFRIFRNIFPFSLYNQHKFKLGSPSKEYRLGAVLFPIFQAVAYMVSRQGAHILTRHNTPITSLADHVFANITPGKWLAVSPNLVSYQVIGAGITTRSNYDMKPPPPPNNWALPRRFSKFHNYEYKRGWILRFERKRFSNWRVRLTMTVLYLTTGFRTRRK